MKKLLLPAACLLLALSLTACHSKEALRGGGVYSSLSAQAEPSLAAGEDAGRESSSQQAASVSADRRTGSSDTAAASKKNAKTPSRQAAKASSVQPERQTSAAGSKPKPTEPASSEQGSSSAAAAEETAKMKLNVQAGGRTFTATLEKNAAADGFMTMMRGSPVVIQMRDYAGFEKVGSLGTSLPASDSQTTAHAGDIVLYNGNQIVIFYGSNSWSYTRLGKIDDLTGWEEALGGGDVTVSFSAVG